MLSHWCLASPSPSDRFSARPAFKQLSREDSAQPSSSETSDVSAVHWMEMFGENHLSKPGFWGFVNFQFEKLNAYPLMIVYLMVKIHGFPTFPMIFALRNDASKEPESPGGPSEALPSAPPWLPTQQPNLPGELLNLHCSDISWYIRYSHRTNLFNICYQMIFTIFPHFFPLQKWQWNCPAPSGVEILEAHGAGWSVSFSEHSAPSRLWTWPSETSATDPAPGLKCFFFFLTDRIGGEVWNADIYIYTYIYIYNYSYI